MVGSYENGDELSGSKNTENLLSSYASITFEDFKTNFTGNKRR